MTLSKELPKLHTTQKRHKALQKERKEAEPRGRAVGLTIPRNYPQSDSVSSLFDQVDNVRVGLVGDGAAINGQDAVAHLKLPTAVRRTAFDDATYFVGHRHARIGNWHTSFCVCVRDCFCTILPQELGWKEGKKKKAEAKGENAD